MLKTLIRGGQTSMHSIRMFSQVAKKIIILLSISFLSITCWLWYQSTPAHDRYILLKWVEANLQNIVVGHDKTANFEIVDKTGRRIQLNATAFVNSAGAKRVKDASINRLIKKSSAAFMGCGLIFCLLMFFMLRFGTKAKKTVYLRGASRKAPKAYNKLVTKNLRSGFTLGGIQLPQSFLGRGTLSCGLPGTGKSIAVEEMMDQVRARGMPAIAFDVDQAFVKNYYRPDKDIIWNPLDERAPYWNIFSEVTDYGDLTRIAESLMPDHLAKSDAFWVSSARKVFATTAAMLMKQGITQTPALLEYLFCNNTEGLNKLVKGTVAEPLTSNKVEKMALSILATLATYCSSLLLTKESPNPQENTFSIRKWVTETKGDSWLFITTKEARINIMRPLISLALDSAINALLSMPPNNLEAGKLFCFFDEFASLHKLPSIAKLSARGRKYGPHLWLSVQDKSQIDETYGVDGAKALTRLLGTRIYYRLVDESADEASKFFGVAEISEAREGLSYGAHEMRDGVNLSRATRQESIILPSEISYLADKEAFIKVSGDWPATKLHFTPKERHAKEPPIVERAVELSPIVDDMYNALGYAQGDDMKDLDENLSSLATEVTQALSDFKKPRVEIENKVTQPEVEQEIIDCI